MASLRIMLAVAAVINVAVSLSATPFIQADKAPTSQASDKKNVVSGQAQNPMPAAPVRTPLVGAEAALDYAQPELTFQKGDSLALPASAGSQSSAVKPAGPSKPIGVATATICSGGGGLWSSPASWSTGMVPTAADDVTISSGCTVVIDTAAVALSVTIQNGGTLQFEDVTARTLTVGQSVTINSGGFLTSAPTGTVTTHVLSVGADLTNNGTLDFSTNGNTSGAGITFTGAGNNTFGGNGATTNIRTLTINKGSSSANILEIITSTLTVQGTTTDGAPMAFLSLINGTLKLSGNFTLTGRVFTSTGYTISATTGFWLNNPNFVVAGQNGSPTNSGLLRISNGTYNVGTATGNSMGAGANAVFTIEGGTFNSTGRLQTANAVTYNQSGGTVNVSTIGNASSSNGSFGFSSAGSLINLSGGTINLVQASTATTPIDYQFSGTANITGGTLNVGTAATATNFTFRIQGQMPSVVTNNTTNNKTANLSAQANVWGNLTINTGTSLNLNSQTLLMIGQTITNNGAITVSTNNTGSVNFAGALGTGVAQTYQGSGTFGAAALRVASVSLQNSAGVTLTSSVSSLNVYRVNAFFGQFTNSNLIAIGAGDATTLVIQRGATGIAAAVGSLDTAPTLNVGSGGLVLVYSQGTAASTTGPEVPASRSILSMQIINPAGVILAGGGITATGTVAGLNGLLLSSGTLTTNAGNLLTLTGTATTAVSGGSAATYVNGPLTRMLPASLVSGSTYTFPVGKGSFKMLELVNPTTNAGGTVTVQTEVFDTDSGGSGGSGLVDIFHNRYWSASITAGAANFTNATVRLTEQVTSGINAIGQSATKTGAYNSIGGTVTQPIIGPSSTITSLGFFAVGVVPGATPMSGNFNTGTGGDFTTLTAAVAALNSRILNGPVTITLTDSTYAGETFPITINANTGSSATNTITIKPAVGISPMISGSSATALIIINGADYVTIDGSNTVGGASRDLTFTNTNAGTSSAVIWGQTVSTADPATNNTIKNLNLIGNASTTTLTGIGFGSSTIASTSVGTRNDNNQVQNNNIMKTQFGIYDQGAASTNKNLGLVITGNQLGGSGANALGRAGIFVGFEDGVQITNNTVNGISGAVINADAFGIALGSISVSTTAFTTNDDVANATVTGNFINNVVKTDTFSAVGISMGTNNYGTSRIANNAISGVNANGTSGDFAAGIYVGGSTGATMQIYYNSVSMTGARDTGGTATSPSFALAVLNSNPLVDIRDNALFNTQTSAGAGSSSYAIGFASVSVLFNNITSNFNDLFTSGAQSAFARTNSLATSSGTDFTTLSAWQSAVAKDANSLSADPLFTSASDLHLQPTSPVLSNGTAIAVTNDIDNDPRPTGNPDIGADELVQATSGTLVGGTYYNVLVSNGDAITGNVTITNMLTLNGKLSTGANTLSLACNATVSGAGGSNYVIGNLKKTYCSAGSFNFVVGTANGYSPVTVNITAGTFPADFTVKAVQGPQPNLGTPSLALQRYWTLTGAGVTADLTFSYLDPTDIPGTANENNFVIFKYDGSFTQPGGSVNTAANTASITGVMSFSDWTLGESGAPTDVALNAFTAEGISGGPKAPQGGVVLRWQTGMEVANLGFNVYRDQAGQRSRLNPNLIAGSALFVGTRTVLGAGRSYVWRDLADANPEAQYWLEEVDLNGRSTWHGPVSVIGKALTDLYEPNARLINELNDGPAVFNTTRVVERVAPPKHITTEAVVQQQAFTKDGTIRIKISREGWYQIKATDLVAAGLDLRSDSRFLQLFVDGTEQPINIVSNKDNSPAGIEFYGTGADSPYTSERAYWLRVGATAGKRIAKVPSGAAVTTGGSFIATVERRDRSLYFSSLRNGEKENFFGAVIVRDPLDQSLMLTEVAARSASMAQLEVALQGVTNKAHSVRVELNGMVLGTLSFANQASSIARFSIAPSMLREGANTVRLIPLGDVSDISLVDYLRVNYPRYYIAENDELKFTARAKQPVTITGFSKPGVRVLDVTDANAVQEVAGIIEAQGTDYAVSFLVPGAGQRRLIALATDLAAPADVALSASSWRQPTNVADLVIITRKEFIASLDPLVALRKEQGLAVAVVDVEAIYNEFSLGQKTPQAIKDFLRYAATSWAKTPGYVMFAGDASYDPKNYLGFGSNDMVPTKLFDSQYLVTATDDWFVDFNDDGVPELGVGRLPARTATEALTMATKIVDYERQRSADSVLLVSDSNDAFNFVAASDQLRALIPGDLRVQSLHRGDDDDPATRSALINAINDGQRLVNYVGHGSADMWRGNVFGNDDVASLTNDAQLTMFVMMTCLNGFYHDASIDSLGERLLKSNRGGAVAVWASSGLTMPDAQAVMNQEAYRLLFNGTRTTIGEVMMRAKAATASGDVRRTWILLGDPSMKLK
jgi:hypothetical protein